MGIIVSKLTVMFEDPFWIALYEREYNGKYEVCKITFGAEPKDTEVYEFIQNNWSKLKFSPSVEVLLSEERRINPKRMQRIINKQIENTGIGTKAQQALKLQQEQCKTDKKLRARIKKDTDKLRQFELRQEKHKEKHRGH